jgi:hypothetical protein
MKKKMPGKKKKFVQDENEASDKTEKNSFVKQIASLDDFSTMETPNNPRDTIFEIANMEPEPENNFLLNYIYFQPKPARDRSRFHDFFKRLSEQKNFKKIEEPKIENPNVQASNMNPPQKNIRFEPYEKIQNVFSSNVTFNELNFGGSENKFDNIHFSNPDPLAQNEFNYFGRHGNSVSSKSTNTTTNISHKRNSTGSLENNVISFPGQDNTNNINTIFNNNTSKTTINYVEKDKEFEPHVDISKVLSLEDKRSTIMIKNIPNKFNRAILLSTIDINFKGTYDLFILPTDGNRNKNFGYSFINFTSSYFIPYFYFMFNNKKWSSTNSKKICEITYSKVQGRDNLISYYANKIIYFNNVKEVNSEQKYIIPNDYKNLFVQLFPNQIIEEYPFYFTTKIPT